MIRFSLLQLVAAVLLIFAGWYLLDDYRIFGPVCLGFGIFLAYTSIVKIDPTGV